MCVGGLQPVQNRRHRHPASKPGRTTGQEGPQRRAERRGDCWRDVLTASRRPTAVNGFARSPQGPARGARPDPAYPATEPLRRVGCSRRDGLGGRTARPPRCSCPVEAFAAFVLVVERDVGAEQGGHLVPRAGAVASDTAAVVGATELPHELGERAAEPEGPGLRADGLGVDAGEQEVLERGRLDALIAGLLFMAGGCGGAR